MQAVGPYDSINTPQTIRKNETEPSSSVSRCDISNCLKKIASNAQSLLGRVSILLSNPSIYMQSIQKNLFPMHYFQADWNTFYKQLQGLQESEFPLDASNIPSLIALGKTLLEDVKHNKNQKKILGNAVFREFSLYADIMQKITPSSKELLSLLLDMIEVATYTIKNIDLDDSSLSSLVELSEIYTSCHSGLAQGQLNLAQSYLDKHDSAKTPEDKKCNLQVAKTILSTISEEIPEKNWLDMLLITISSLEKSLKTHSRNDDLKNYFDPTIKKLQDTKERLEQIQAAMLLNKDKPKEKNASMCIAKIFAIGTAIGNCLLGLLKAAKSLVGRATSFSNPLEEGISSEEKVESMEIVLSKVDNIASRFK